MVEDARAIAEIQVASWRAAYRGLVPDEFLDAFTPAARQARWAARLQASEGDTYVTDGGFCSVVRPARDASAPVELAALYVAPHRWRSGLGSALVEAALPLDEEVTLWVFRDNPTARAFYEAHGFFDDGAEATDPGTGVLEIRMRRAACARAR